MSAERMQVVERAPRFGRALLLALFAGLGALPWQLVFGSPWSDGGSLAHYQLALTVLAVAAGAPSLRSALIAGGLSALLCAGLALTSPGMATAMLGALLVLGLMRSALCYPRPFARALAGELLLALPAVAAFAVLYDGYPPTPIANPLAFWAFWLVQSAFALLPAAPRVAPAPAQDRFEAALAAADRLMR